MIINLMNLDADCESGEGGIGLLPQAERSRVQGEPVPAQRFRRRRRSASAAGRPERRCRRRHFGRIIRR